MIYLEKLLRKSGTIARALILDQIKSGYSVDGDKYEYGTESYYRPYARGIVNKLGGKAGEGVYYDIVTRKNGQLGMIILGGYKAFKAKVNPSAATDFLVYSGKMLRNFKLLTLADSTVTLGFDDPVQQQKAYWLQVSGAGKSRKKWRFIGLNEEQVKKITDAIAPDLRKLVETDLIEKINKFNSK